MRAPAGITWSSGCRENSISTNSPGVRLVPVRGEAISSAPALDGSAQPFVMRLSLISPFSVQGSDTSHTDRLAAGASADTRTRTLATPER